MAGVPASEFGEGEDPDGGAKGVPTDWQEIPAIQDREVSEPEGDRFGHRDLELALRGLIESEAHAPPYSIGLLGRWGSGKSTVRAIYEKRLADHAERSRRFRTISFNAWRFGKEEVKRALLRHLYLELGGDDSRLRDELYRQVQRSSTEQRPRSLYYRGLEMQGMHFDFGLRNKRRC